MLEIGVQLPGRFDDSGDYLADAWAMDAAGVDSIWLDDEGYDRWQLLAAIAAVTGRARLMAPLTLRPRGSRNTRRDAERPLTGPHHAGHRPGGRRPRPG
jgi:hypothetical protein